MIDEDRLTRWYDFQASFYHLWRDSYDSDVITTIAGAVFADAAPKRVLDVGCGSGWLSAGLALRQPGSTFCGIDPSQGLLRIGRREAAKRGLTNLELLGGNAYALPFGDAEFEVLTVGGLFPNINDRARAIAEMARVLKPGGTLVVVEYDRSAMSVSSRLFYKTMVFGYHMISSIFWRFRFAAKWDIDKGTVDRADLTKQLSLGGFQVTAEYAADHQMIIVLELEKS